MYLAVSASAIDPNRQLSQYSHGWWGTEKGFPGGTVSSIAQTPDGYLWVGTDKGLVRFDGLNFRQFEQAGPSLLPIGPVQKLLVDARGDLWILLQSTKLLRYHDGILELSRGEAENGITVIARGVGNTLLLSSLAKGTLTYDGKQFLTALSGPVIADSASVAHGETPDERSSRLSWSTGVVPHRVVANATSEVISLAATTDGKVWLGTLNRGLFYLQERHVSPASGGLPDMKVTCLLPLDNSELWIGTSNGVWHSSGTELSRTGVPSSLLNVEVLAMIRDRDSNIWVGTTRGLLRFNPRGVSSLPGNTPAAGGPVTALFEDRERNIWIGSARGLERLRDSAFVTYSVRGLKSQTIGPVYVDAGNNTWFALIEGGFRSLKGGEGGAVTAAGLAHDIVYSISGKGENDLWVGRQHGGLTHLHKLNNIFTAKTYTQAEGLAQNSVYAVYQSHDGSVWSGTLGGGVSVLRKGHFTTYDNTNGLAANTVSSIAEGPDGTMWFGTPNGLSAMSTNRWRTYKTGNGLPSNDVNCLSLDANGVLWIGTGEGLAFFKDGLIHVPVHVPASLHEPIFGIAEDRTGSLWVATASHVLQVRSAALLRDSAEEADVREYLLADGLYGTEGVKRYQSVLADSQGHIWFSTNRGLSVVNPARLTVDSIPALLHIEAVFVDGSPLRLSEPLKFSVRQKKTTFRFVGLSLANSERVRYRYWLEGFDKGWSEPVSTQEVSYSNLEASSYRFHVMASNSYGLWNATEAAVQLQVEPMLWQTWWFRLLLIFCGGLLTLSLYRLRVRQVTKLLIVRFEERLAERTRIAQDLHDTLLQGVLSASMQLHVVTDSTPEGSPVRPALDRILQTLGQVIEEGRNTLRGLRSSIGATNDLQDSLSRIPQELGNQSIGFRVVVEGAPLPLRSAIRDDVYRIGREAIVNAFRHSGAKNIDLHIDYGVRQLRFIVRDDGCGVDPQVLHSGRDGHWGIFGMKERAERIGGAIRLLSRAGGGMEVELRVPRNVAFESHSPSSASKWFARLPGLSAEIARTSKQRDGQMSAPKQIRVFSVDDHPLLHQGLATVIQTQSDMALVAEASNGRDAVQRFREHTPDVTLMDLRLPDMSGIDAMIAIRSEFPDARIIILTTFAGDAEIQRALEAGARAYVLKSMPPKEIVEVIRQVHAGKMRIPPEIAAHLAEHYSDEALTGREIEVLRQIAGGNRNRDIAEKLFITEETVKVHIKHIMEKLGASDRTQAVAIGVRRGIIQL